MSAAFQPPSKSLTTRDYQFLTLVVILFVILSSLLVYANLTFRGGGGDFYVLWVGGRAFTIDKIEPYSGDVAALTQRLVYADPAKPGDKPYILDTPFYILLLYFPFSLLSDPLLARAIFTLILELAFFALALLSLRLADWDAPRLFYFLFIIFAGINFYTFQAIYNASPILLLGLAYAGILISLRVEMDELTGALMAISLYYWEAGAPFLLFVILRVYYEKRSRVFAGFFMASFILLAIAFLLYPGWIIPYLRASFNNGRMDFGLNVRTAFDHLLPSFGHSFAWIFISLLVIILGYEWSMARGADFRRYYWASCLSLAAAPLLGFRTEISNLTVLVIPLALIFSIVHDRWKRFGGGITLLLMLLIVAFPWFLYFYARDDFGRIAQELIFLFLPLLTIIGLYWIRWWALRPPRTWLDLTSHL